MGIGRKATDQCTPCLKFLHLSDHFAVVNLDHKTWPKSPVGSIYSHF